MNLRESFSLPYAGTDLWYSCLDNLGNDSQLIKEKILQEEKLIARPSCPSLVLYHLYGTGITDELAEVLAGSLIRAQQHMQKLALIGLTRDGKAKIRKYMRKSGLKLLIPSQYFEDFEKAKEWLVGAGTW